jgi:hypothetical protein
MAWRSSRTYSARTRSRYPTFVGVKAIRQLAMSLNSVASRLWYTISQWPRSPSILGPAAERHLIVHRKAEHSRTVRMATKGLIGHGRSDAPQLPTDAEMRKFVPCREAPDTSGGPAMSHVSMRDDDRA